MRRRVVYKCRVMFRHVKKFVANAHSCQPRPSNAARRTRLGRLWTSECVNRSVTRGETTGGIALEPNNATQHAVVSTSTLSIRVKIYSAPCLRVTIPLLVSMMVMMMHVVGHVWHCPFPPLRGTNAKCVAHPLRPSAPTARQHPDQTHQATAAPDCDSQDEHQRRCFHVERCKRRHNGELCHRDGGVICKCSVILFNRTHQGIGRIERRCHRRRLIRSLRSNCKSHIKRQWVQRHNLKQSSAPPKSHAACARINVLL